MNSDSRSPAFATSFILPIVAAVFAIDIFLVDTFTSLEGAVAVLYLVVVLIAANFLQRRGIILIALSCLALTVVSYRLSHLFDANAALVRVAVSMFAIVITTILALRVRQRERELRLTIDTMPALAWQTDPEGSAEYLNKRWLDYTGLSLDKALGWDWTAAVHPDDLPALRESVDAIVASGKRAETEARLRRSDGDFRWFLFRFEPLRDDRGHIVRWYATNTDIEDIKRAEEALRRSEAYLAEAQRLSLTGSFGWKVASGELFWSEETYRIFEYDPSTKMTVDLALQRVHPEDIDLVLQMIERAESGPIHMDFHHRLLMSNGAVKTVHVLARVIEDTNVLEYVGALMDITAARQSEEALHKTQTELAHVTRMTTLGELTASIAHEVNQPLTGIVINGTAGLRWLGQNPPALDEVRSSMEDMISDAQRASEVIKRVRALSKKGEPEKAPLDVNDVVEDGIRLVQREVLAHRAVLRTELASALPPVLGDRVQLQQVIINLLVNGIQAMESVTDRPRELLIRTELDDTGRVLVSVKDSGIGIDPQSADRLFNAFFTTKSGGMGMGLSIVRSIIESHGGRVWAANHAGPGAIFQFTLPFVRDGA